jgi:hypothetical protein
MLVLVDPARRELTLADGAVKILPAAFAGMYEEEAEHESLEDYVRGHQWIRDSDQIAVLDY